MLELISMSYSPWSEKARWALDHHGVQFSEKDFKPLLSELSLRARMKQWSGKFSIPTLLTDDECIGDSYNIAHYAEEIGSDAEPLFPKGVEEEIHQWNALSEEAMAAGRAIVSQRVLDDPKAKLEALPKMPGPLRQLMKPLANIGVSYLRKKYTYDESIEKYEESFEQVLIKLRAALEGAESYLIGSQFSYADITMAVALQCLKPVTDDFLKIGPATRVAWTNEAMADKYADLLDWRDHIYEQHRARL